MRPTGGSGPEGHGVLSVPEDAANNIDKCVIICGKSCGGICGGCKGCLSHHAFMSGVKGWGQVVNMARAGGVHMVSCRS